MKAVVVAVVLSVLGATVSGQYAATVFPYYQKGGQVFSLQETTTSKPYISTETSMSPQTSVSVHHTIVRNKPAYPYPYTESTMQSEGSEDTSYYYTYEDSSEEKGKFSSTTPIPAVSTTAKAIRSFWNSQKAQLDARRKEGSQKFMPTYGKPTARSETTRPKIEFKVREKPKFGLSNKNKETVTDKTVTKDNQTEDVPSTTPISIKFKANLATEKDSEKDEVTKGSSSKSSGPALQNQIEGRIGEIPLQNRFKNQKQASVGSQGNSGNYQQPPLRNNLNSLPPVASTLHQQTLPTGNNPDPFMIDLTQRQQALTQNQQSILATNQQLQNSIHALLNSNQQAILNANQQPVLNPQQQPIINTQQQPILRSNQQQVLNSNQLPVLQQPSRPAIQSFISTSPAEAGRPTEQYVNTNSPASTLLQRLGSLGLNLGGGDLGGLIQGREGGYGGPSGLSFNLGPVTDPLSVLLKLLSLLPRPLLDLNGRLFFGIELGKNAGLTSGVGGKQVGRPIG